MAVSQVTITSKSELIDYTTAEWNTFVSYVDGLTEDHWIGPKDASGWSVKDHVSHVTQWDIPVIELFRNGTPMQQTFEIPDDLWTLEDYDPMNERIRQRNLGDSVQTVQGERDSTWTSLLSVLEDLTDARLAGSPVDSGLNVGDEAAPSLLLELVDYLGGHYAEHLGYIRIIVGDGAE